MIVVRLMGGFANQLFQYAAGRALAVKLNEKLFLDTSFLDADPKGSYTKREFELNQIRFSGEMAPAYLLEKFRSSGFVNKVLNKLRLSSHYIFNETRSTYMAGFGKLKGNVLLNGYWQSDKYFANCMPQLLTEIRPSYEYTEQGKQYLEMILQSDSVSVHVRRGDYIHHKGASDFHGICDISYYKRCIDHINKVTKEPKYFVFSDDISWCKKNFHFSENMVFVEDEKAKQSSQDMFIMSHCKHNIIANSSYSWWAARLNQNQSGIVIAPEKWFEDKNINTSDLYPAGWLKL